MSRTPKPLRPGATIGPACPEALGARTSAPAFTDELRSGVGLGTTRGNLEQPKTGMEYSDAKREARGVRTRPARPGQHA